MASCTVNETCKEKTFGDYIWNQDGGTFAMGNIQFQVADSITLLSAGSKRLCNFDEGCEGMTVTIGAYSHWYINKPDDNHIILTANDSITASFTRQ